MGGEIEDLFCVGVKYMLIEETVRRVKKSGSLDGKTTMSICEAEHKYNLFSSYFSQ